MNYSICVSFGGREIEVSVEVETEVSNDGIGVYEYWGARRYDRGTINAAVTGWRVVEAHFTDNDKRIDVTPALLHLIAVEMHVQNDAICEKAIEQAAENAQYVGIDRALETAIDRAEHYYHD